MTYVTSFLYFRYILICIYSVYIGQYIFFNVPLFMIFYRIKINNKKKEKRKIDFKRLVGEFQENKVRAFRTIEVRDSQIYCFR